MGKYSLRLIALIILLIICIILKFFTHLSLKVIISIAIIAVFLIIFTYIFQIPTNPLFKVFLIFFTIIVLPIFISLYLDIFSILGLFGSVISCIIVGICGIAAIYAMVELNYLEVEVGDEVD